MVTHTIKDEGGVEVIKFQVDPEVWIEMAWNTEEYEPKAGQLG